jgi:hypothetical protein
VSVQFRDSRVMECSVVAARAETNDILGSGAKPFSSALQDERTLPQFIFAADMEETICRSKVVVVRMRYYEAAFPPASCRHTALFSPALRLNADSEDYMRGIARTVKAVAADCNC